MSLSVSIVTKTYNRFHYLLECIRSVQFLCNEPYTQKIQWEHVIYDDGSTDETKDHFDNHHYPHTRYIRSDVNEGISHATNLAIRTCKSDYIFELDSDDVVPTRTLVNFYETIASHPDIRWIVASFFQVDSALVYQMGHDYYGWIYDNPRDVLMAIMQGKHFIQHNVLYRRDLWEKVGGYDESLTMAEDLDLYVRFLLDGSMPVYTPYVSHFHRMHDGNVSKGVDMKHHMHDIAGLYRKYEKQLIPMGIYPPQN